MGNTSSEAIPIISTVISAVIGLKKKIERYLAKKKVKDQVFLEFQNKSRFENREE